ncbi:hypothetical protein K457DRAFT_244162 [Linnemannia elongata AG-77]|uniref:Uncharacterized protein n=1 Tax=Linnemannia elongata AG-77 TaxID=1314771 RepID=A0A197JFB9_9FUNG|nr:hypothetical protein K457DRAFT_244162 [Linnemannia elongata AG-77]
MELVKNPFLLSPSLEALRGVTGGRQDLSAIRIIRVQLYDTFVNHWLAISSRRLQRNVLTRDDQVMLDQLLKVRFITMALTMLPGWLRRSLSSRMEPWWCNKLTSRTRSHRESSSLVPTLRFRTLFHALSWIPAAMTSTMNFIRNLALTFLPSSSPQMGP